MQVCNTRVSTTVHSEGEGPACMIVCNQDAADPGSWDVDLYAIVPGTQKMRAFVRRTQISAPSAVNPPTRVLLAITLPGVSQWIAEVIPPAVPPNRPIDVGLFAGPMTSAAPTNVAP